MNPSPPPSRFPLSLAGAALALGLAASCTSDPYVQQGRLGGAAAGAIAGGVIGNNVDGVSSWEGAAAGALLGGVLGDTAAKANSAYHGRTAAPYPPTYHPAAYPPPNYGGYPPPNYGGGYPPPGYRQPPPPYYRY